MQFDVYWLINVIASALLAGASARLFVYLAKRVLVVEIPPRRLSGMGLGLVMLSTFIGGWYHVGYAALVAAGIVTYWCAILLANKWVESPHFGRFAEQMSANPAPATGSQPPTKAGRRRFTILAPTLLEALKCPAVKPCLPA
jgi:heme A synthase